MSQLFPNAFMTFMMYGINFFISAITIISLCFIFIKMRQPAWKAIIPYYNTWIMVKSTKQPVIRFWMTVGSIAAILVIAVVFIGIISVSAVTGAAPSPALLIIFGVLYLAAIIVALVYGIKITHGLSKCFGYGAGFTTGLILLPIVFFPVLAFGDSVFTEPENPKPANPEMPTQPENPQPDFAAVPLTGDSVSTEESSDLPQRETTTDTLLTAEDGTPELPSDASRQPNFTPDYSENPVEAESGNPLDRTVARLEDEADEF